MNRKPVLGPLLLGLTFLAIFAADRFLAGPFSSFAVSAELTITTPALLFPAISLLLLAYTNRFLVLAQLVRDLHSRYIKSPDELLLGQIDNLRRRIALIKDMQFLGVSSFFLCVFCMLLIFFERKLLAELVFGCSLLLLMASLGLSIREIRISVDALNLHLSDLEKEKRKYDSIKNKNN